MGWKASTIIINPRGGEVQYEELLTELGFLDLKEIEDEPFECAIYPDDGKVFIGTYQDNLLICAPDLPMTFFEETLSNTEKLLAQRFPGSETCAIVLHSTVNVWGFSIAKQGKRIRAKGGSADDCTFVDYGEPVEQEMELLSKSSLNKEGARIYTLDRFPDEPFTEDQVGESFVFAITTRYFGVSLDRAETLLFETVLKGYRYTKPPKQAPKPPNNVEPQAKKEDKPWWKFWG